MRYALPFTDIAAAIVFAACWFAYGRAATLMSRSRPSLVSAVRHFRQAWISQMCGRESRIADATLLSNLLRGALFFASTTVLILGGLAALLGNAAQVATAMSQLPGAIAGTTREAEVKILLMLLLFVYAFFKFTWSAWQYNVLSIMVGAMPPPDSDAGLRARFAEAGAEIASLAGDSYNNGIRAYYFSIPLLAWLVHPLASIAATLAVTFVIYRREFHAPMLDALEKAMRQ